MESSLSILLIENHPDTLKYMRLYLERLGHAVEGTTTVRDGMERLETGGYDVVISDIGLADGDGRDVLRRVQLSRPIYGIAMSGFGLPSDRSKSEAAGFRHHLLKPFQPKILEAHLAEALSEKRARLSQIAPSPVVYS